MLPETEMKIYKLIELCRRSKNYRILFEVGLKLISVKVKNLAIALDMEDLSFEKIKDIYRQVEIISVFYERIYKKELIEKNKIEDLKEIEHAYQKELDNIPYRYISDLYKIYYLLKDVEISKEETKEVEMEVISLNLDETVNKKITELKNRLKEDFSQDKFSELIQLKLVKETFKNKEKKQVQVEGSLKDSPHSADIFSKQGEYFFISLIVITLGIGFFLIVEFILFPYLYEVLSFFLFISLGIAVLMLLLYWKVFMEKPSEETFLNSVFNV